MDFVHIAFLAQVFTTFAMTGLIWFVQVVHYPLFAWIADPQHREYAVRHQRRTGWVVGPMMLVELVTALLLLVPAVRPVPVSFAGAIAGLALIAAIWLSTVVLQVPVHGKLLNGHNAEAISRLVLTNWIRTAAWSLRTVLIVSWLLKAS
jgi:hypothetical protein